MTVQIERSPLKGCVFLFQLLEILFLIFHYLFVKNSKKY